eukprot:1158617-Pelagomonas_calceolata.AAC.1
MELNPVEHDELLQDHKEALLPLTGSKHQQDTCRMMTDIPKTGRVRRGHPNLRKASLVPGFTIAATTADAETQACFHRWPTGNGCNGCYLEFDRGLRHLMHQGIAFLMCLMAVSKGAACILASLRR